MIEQSLRDKIKADPRLMAELWKIDYLEKPVDIETFLSDPMYLGKSTRNGEKIYPVWKETLKHVFENQDITEVILTGSIGGGKSSCAVLAMCYLTHRTLCLRNPYEFYSLLVGKPLTFVFFSMTLSLTSSTNFMAYQRMMQNSPWFMSKGQLRGNVEPILHFPLVDYKLCSPRASGGASVGADVVGGLLDEINNPGEPVSIKERTFRMYQGTVRRIESRFMSQGKLKGMKLFLCASKDDELSFVDKHIEQRRGAKDVYIVDKSIWEVKPFVYSGAEFPVVLGDAYHDPKIVDESERQKYVDLGHRIIDVPIEHFKDFSFDVIGALRDIAGVTTRGLRKRKLFPNISFLTECYNKNASHPFTKSEIDMNLFSVDEIIHYFRLSDITIDRTTPRYIHIDLGISGDSAGVACSYVAGSRPYVSENIDGQIVSRNLPVINTEWVLRINPERDSQIPIAKIKKFVFDLVSLGFNIRVVTMDGYQSTDLNQTFIRAGIESRLLSIDRTADAYNNLKDLIFDRRWSCYRYDRLHFELSNLEIDPDTGKIDHPHMVKDLDSSLDETIYFGSKDISDAVAGSVTTALLELPTTIDMRRMSDMFDRVKSGGREAEMRMPVVNMFKVDGKELYGVKTGGNLTKFQEIFEKIHNRSKYT